MLFSSYAFLFAFLPVVLAGWWGLRSRAARLAFLTLASWVFYGWWDWRFVPLLVALTVLNFVAGLAIARAGDAARRKSLLVAAIAIDVAVLGYFKYAGFFVESLDGLGSAVGLGGTVGGIDVLLPIGISFYTFISIAYVVDVYRRAIEPTRSLLEYATFVGGFPHVIAGPILRFGDVSERLRRPASALTSSLAMVGLFFLVCGLFKKVVIADRLAPSVDLLFADPDRLGLVTAWAAAIGYSLQLYFDFSGYSDMAVGIAWLLGFRYPQNFDSPYKATSLTDFWTRWHMTLSRWLRDYLFFPLARRYATGSSRGAGRRERLGTYACLFLTMAIAGLWHGAAWTFVVWGAMHGLVLASERGYRDLRRLGGRRAPVVSRFRKAVQRAATFGFVVAAFVVFRSPSLPAAGDVLAAMLGLNGIESGESLEALLTPQFVALLAVLLVFVNAVPNTWQVNVAPRIRYGLVLGAAAAVALMSIAVVQTFIYFQF
jgi:alginate O-acetyltransferase complex protein AlgI